MGELLKGLAARRQQKQEEEARREAARKPKTNRFEILGDKESVVVRFAQEMDYDAKHYDAEAGIGGVSDIHRNGDDKRNGWKNQAVCSVDSQGDCFACEKARDQTRDWDDRKDWKKKGRFFINLVAGEPREVVTTNAKGKEVTKYVPTDIDRKTGDGTVYLLEQSEFNGIYDDLESYAVEDETITENYWKITRKGTGFNDTKYTLTKLKEVPEDAKALSEFELYNIREDVLTEVPYIEQRAFYFRGMEQAPESEEEPVAAAASTDETW